MDINCIDLLELKQKVIAGKLSTNDIETINRIIWCYDDVQFKKCDIILVLGNPTCVNHRLPTALDLFANNKGAYLVLSGGVQIPGLGLTEAEHMKNAALKAGIPIKQILLENESTTTKENIINSAPHVKSLVRDDCSLAVVSSATHLRRIMMNFQKYKNLYPSNLQVIPIADFTKVNRCNWLQNNVIRSDVATELGFIHEYLYDLDYPLFVI